MGHVTASGCINPAHRKIVTYRKFAESNYDDYNGGHGTHVVGSVAGSAVSYDASQLAFAREVLACSFSKIYLCLFLCLLLQLTLAHRPSPRASTMARRLMPRLRLTMLVTMKGTLEAFLMILQAASSHIPMLQVLESTLTAGDPPPRTMI